MKKRGEEISLVYVASYTQDTGASTYDAHSDRKMVACNLYLSVIWQDNAVLHRRTGISSNIMNHCRYYHYYCMLVFFG